jgi:hypothetical protein
VNAANAPRRPFASSGAGSWPISAIATAYIADFAPNAAYSADWRIHPLLASGPGGARRVTGGQGHHNQIVPLAAGGFTLAAQFGWLRVLGPAAPLVPGTGVPPR